MGKNRDGYANFADLYDLETKDGSIQAFYKEWRESLLESIRLHAVKVRVLVDLACGTGNSTIPWTRHSGWAVVGVDRSLAMLRIARKKSRQVRWVRQDLTRLRLEEKADVVTCHFDALNHLLLPRDLQRTFSNVARLMNDGGIFQFDMSTEYWLRWLSRHEKLYRIGPHYCMSFNEYNARRGVATFHQLWFVKNGRSFEKREIKVQERAYSTILIRRMLAASDLRLLNVSTQRRLEGRPIRLLFLAKRVSRGGRNARERIGV